MKCTLVKPNPCPFCGEQLQLVTELSPIETTSGKVISEFRMNYYKHTETDKYPAIVTRSQVPAWVWIRA